MRRNLNDGFQITVWLSVAAQPFWGLPRTIDIPYPSPADRRDLENLVKGSWDSKVQKPMGVVADYGSDQYHHAKEWIFDTYAHMGHFKSLPC